MDITVTDIVTRAGVARASFYRNFNSINDVIDAISDEMSSELIEDISPLGKWG
ncbi:MAG: TetR/AcrR family transcriptional regulator [Lentihominibacter sp.]|nr:TetR/AcrR family transcriptional regulator [Clostridiales bacterium]MDY2679119.1 TetR/AcrR family transcriptional regulator [Lentihominibacter sp.]